MHARPLAAATLLLIALDAGPATARSTTPRCEDGQWVVDGADPFGDPRNLGPTVLAIADRRITVPRQCQPVRVRTKRRSTGIVVKARWRACVSAEFVRLQGVIDRGDCRRFEGRLTTGDPRRDVAITATRALRVLVFSRTAGFRHPSIADAHRVLGALGARDGIVPTITEDPAVFDDATLAGFDVVLFANTTGDVLHDTGQAAMERFIRRGGGYVGVHSAADTEYGWPWYGRLVGAYFRNHPLLPVSVTVTTEDGTHPSTAHLPERFTFIDEIYNFDRNPRVDNAVLLTVDEAGFIYPNFPAGPSMGADHPIAWYKEFDGGRSFYTNLGHRPESWDDPGFRQHLLEGIRWAAGPVSWSRAVLTDDARNPMALAVAPDGRAYYVERTGEVRMWSPATGRTLLAARLDVDTAFENGLLGIVLDPGFASNGWIYLYHSTPVSDPPPSTGPPGENVLSRFTTRSDGTLDLATRVDLIRVPSERACCHEGGSLAFAPDGTLFLSTGDNTNAFGDALGYAPLDERPGRSQFNSQRTAANPFDLRGKILRINPDGSIPSGNLFPPDGAAGRPEIYTMGSRNPFRITVDQRTGRLYWGEVGPDAVVDGPRGPRGYDEINFADAPGNYGWPYCIADNQPYADVDFATGSAGGAFSCDGYRPALLFYDYVTISHLALGNAIASEGPSLLTGRTAIAGTVYRRPAGDPPFALPAPWADTLLMTDWTRDVLASVAVTPDGGLGAVRRLLPWERFRRPIDLEVGSDGALYVLEYGTGYAGDNADAALSRVEYSEAGRLRPIAVLETSAAAGAAPLTVTLSGERSRAPGHGDRLVRYEWDLDGDGRTDALGSRIAHTFRRPGTYPVTLVVRAASGERSFPVSRQVIVGNAPPEVTILEPADATVVPRGRTVTLRGRAHDAEDGEVSCGRLTWEIFLGHNAHAHPFSTRSGCETTLLVDPDTGHGDATNLFFVAELIYTDAGGAAGEPSITTRQSIRVLVGSPTTGSPGGAFLAATD